MLQGHDTTASCITMCLYNIAKYPEVQKKCVEEIRNIFGDDKQSQPTLKQLNDLQYLTMVIKETLRLYPMIPFIPRRADGEIKLSKFPIFLQRISLH